MTLDPGRLWRRRRRPCAWRSNTHNIEARPVWKPLHLQPVFAGCEQVGGAVAEEIFASGLCLPSGSNLTADDLARVADVICRRRPSPVRRQSPAPLCLPSPACLLRSAPIDRLARHACRELAPLCKYPFEFCLIL